MDKGGAQKLQSYLHNHSDNPIDLNHYLGCNRYYLYISIRFFPKRKKKVIFFLKSVGFMIQDTSTNPIIRGFKRGLWFSIHLVLKDVINIWKTKI
jgi:hypothetical protein